ncbi:hypothetical protein Q0F99_10180 [Rathayibacter oskolensis]|nr:hypothetical protein [Rathayibacter oskolensis]WKK73151.1 hypothetical protein Q0F99_10180 [Rathayibacter oskolensis]
MTEHAHPAVGFAPDEIDTSAPTRAARLSGSSSSTRHCPRVAPSTPRSA